MVLRSFLIVTSYNIVSFIACCNLIDVLCVIVIYFLYIYMYVYDYLSFYSHVMFAWFVALCYIDIDLPLQSNI